jgi:F-type H+-transporting ATPase subunit epsilon
MTVEIVSPEATLFKGEVDSVSVPGVNGEFQMLNHHAPIVSLLGKGFVKISGQQIKLTKANKDKFTEENGSFWLPIQSGTIELKNNHVIVLAD